MARDDTPHGRDGEVRMTPLERHARWLLRAYPATYRRERGEEIIGTLLEASAGRTWPRVRDVRALTIGGLKACAAQNRQRSVGLNLSVAVMAGLAIYLSYWVGGYLSVVATWWFGPVSIHVSSVSAWTSAVAALLVGVAVILAWTARLAAVLVAALAASAGVISYALVIGGPAAMLGPSLLQVLALAGLAALAPRAGHASRHWLWVPGAFAVAAPLMQLSLNYGWPGATIGLPLRSALYFVIVIAAILWIGIDARLMVAVLTYLADRKSVV